MEPPVGFRQRAEAIVASFAVDIGLELVITGEYEYKTAWAFSYDSKLYVETGSLSHALAGNGPVIIPKNGRSHWIASTAIPLEEQLQ